MHYKCEIIAQSQTNFNLFNCSGATITKTATNYKLKITNQLSTTTTTAIKMTLRFGQEQDVNKRWPSRIDQTHKPSGGNLKTCHNSQTNAMCES